MVPIPVSCDGCGLLFTAENIVGGNGVITFVDVRFGPCPNCGAMGRVLDGTYGFIDDVLTVLEAPAWSVQKLQELEALLHAAQSGQRPAGDVLHDIAADSSDLADFVSRAIARGWDAIKVISVLMAIVTFVQTEDGQPAKTSEDVQRVDRMLESLAQSDNAVARPLERHSRPAISKRPKKPPKTHGKRKRRRR
jgi:hypothetical protein